MIDAEQARDRQRSQPASTVGGAIPVPEVNLTPQEMIRRATAMRHTLRDRQAATEAEGRLLAQTNEEFINAGFYRVVQPRRFGGYEFDLTTYVRVMSEVARGCPSSGWVLALTSGHPIILADHSEQAQIEAYGNDGEYRCPSLGSPIPVQPVPGGYRVSGFWDFASGCDIATHIMASGLIAQEGAAPKPVLMLIDRQDYSITDNWNMLGMQGTGSRRVVVDNLFVPEHRVAPLAMWVGAAGDKVHPNPMYNGRKAGFFMIEGGAVLMGTARGMLDLYDELLRNKPMRFAPKTKLMEHHEFQHYFGVAQALMDNADAALLKAAQDYMDACTAQSEQGVEFSEEEDRRIFLMVQQATRLAFEAADRLFTTAGTQTGQSTSMFGRYYRDLAIQRTHFTQQMDRTAVNFARIHFGFAPLSPF
ncbi:acyl-CoA dehydrogenase family protein [Pseudomonas extremaustralis]|uniref:acyl-CoA dehydrogenase family protein n=1 Tax=Pseudomonas extremaustralis TaxID=359110 RepID=UPI002AA854F5|nr:acyl-CoA dehydrogenase family protein [Pseudomonas extremaustralis]